MPDANTPAAADPFPHLTHGELLAAAEAAGFRFDVWSCAGDGPGRTEEGVTIRQPRFEGPEQATRLAIFRALYRRMFMGGLREFVILRELARRPVSTAGYSPTR